MRFTRIKNNEARATIRLPLLGKIRLGIKKTAKSGKEYPAETDYFVVPPEVKRVFGDEPKQLPVMLPVEDEDKFLRQYYACYGSNQKLKCQGDGELAERRDEHGKKFEIPCPSPDACDFAKQFGCKARIDLMVVLPQVNCGGTYQLSSGSINTDIDLRSGIEMAKHLFGRISWVPMNLSREERKIPDPETGKMQTHWPVRLNPQATVTEVNQIRMDTKRIIERQERFALPEPDNEEGHPTAGDLTSGEEQQDHQESAVEEKAKDTAEAQGVDEFLAMVESAQTVEELDKLFKNNRDAINRLKPQVMKRVIDAKHKREAEIQKAA